jgi:nitrite transporter NirC
MEREGIEAVVCAALKKLAFFRCKWRFVVYAMLAGAFCSIGMAFAYTVGAAFSLTPTAHEFYRLGMGIGFSLSFTLIIFAGCELFTSNVLAMTISLLTRSAKVRDVALFLALCYVSNLMGAAFMGGIVGMTGILNGPVGDLIVKSSVDKMALPFVQAFFRGVMCNVLVCLGYWAMTKARSETAKLIIIVWVVAGFVTPGYEHSIANAGIFAMAFLSPSTAVFPPGGVWANLVPVSLGNLAGGALFVGLPYWIAGAASKNVKEVQT